MRILLVRHGDWAADQRSAGQADGDLTALGLQQCNAIAMDLARQGIAALYASDMRRAVQTAQVIGEETGRNVNLSAKLREIHRGDWEFVPYAQRQPPDMARLWEQHPSDLRYPGGECGQDVFNRASSVIGAIWSDHCDEVVCIVTHGGIIRSLLAGYLGVGQERRFQWEIGHCSVTTLDMTAGGAVTVRRIAATTIR